MIHSIKNKYSIGLLLTFLFFFNSLFADDEFDPFMPEQPDPGNADVSQYLTLFFVIGLLFAASKIRKRKTD